MRDPGPGEVRVAIKAAGLCHSDLSVIDGTIPYPVPVVLGHEGAGVIDAVGVGVRSVKEGDTVIVSTLSHCGRCAKCDAGHPTECRNAPSPKDAKPFTVGGKPAFQFANASVFAEYTVVREQGAILIDPRVPFDRAALIGCGVMTGFGAVVNRARVETGSTMAVFGVGGIGLNCVQGGVLAARRRSSPSTSCRRSSSGRSASAPRTSSTARRTIRWRRSRTSPAAAPTTRFECVGNVAVIKQALEAIGPGGSMTIVGVPKVGTTYEFVVHALYQNKSILGCRYGAARPQRDFPMLADLYLSGRLKIDELITRHYALDDFDHALDDLRAGHLARGVFAMAMNRDPR